MKTFTSSKTIKRMLLVLLVCSLITGTLTACGSKKKQSGITTFTVGFDAEFPPYGYKDDNGEYVGFDLSLAQEVCKRNGWELVKQPIDWDSKDMELSSGTIDCIWNGFTMNGRESDYTWTTPYIDNSQVVIVKSGSSINKLTDLSGKVVVVQADSSMTPVIFIINHLAMLVLRLMGVKASEGRQAMTESELRTIVDVSHESGVIESEEKEMINNVFDFGDALAKEVMIPRIDMTFAQVDNTYDEILDIFREDRFTRLPVYEETTDDVIGILNIKDLLLCDREHFSVRELMREPYFTYEHKHTADLLVEMRNSSINIAIVLDEYGTTAGLLTLEDLIEEIVGEIRDEYDYDEEDPIQKISDHEYLVEGSMNLADFSDELNLHLESDDYDSIGGYMIGLLDHLPKIRESITTPDGIFLQVRTKNKHRIEKIYVRLPETSAESETTEQSV